MKYKLKKTIPVAAPKITELIVGLSYFGFVQAYQGLDGPVTVSELHNKYPDFFELIDTTSVKTQIMINLSNQYVDLQKHYGFDEDGMANKLGEIAEKICSKI